MLGKTLVMGVVGSLVLAAASIALGADVGGTVSDLNSTPVQRVQIIVKDASGKIVGKVTTDSRGHYEISGLTPGAYQYVLDPLGTPFKGGTAASYLRAKGLTIDWKVSTNNSAVALATEGTSSTVVAGDPFGLSPLAFGALVVGATAVVAGGVIGGYVAAGGFSSSPSM